MMRIRAYLTFNGNCREAMTFYKQTLGGELMLQPIADSPMAHRMPEKMKDRILHSSLTKDGFVLMASDMVGDDGLLNGNSVSLMLDCGSEDEIRDSYAKLSDGGERTHPLETTFWGALFGNVKDKFGIYWLLHYQLPKN